MWGCLRRVESNGGAQGTSAGTTKNCSRSRVIGYTKLKFINNFLSASNASPSAFSFLYLVLCPRVRVRFRFGLVLGFRVQVRVRVRVRLPHM